jgi:ankyrin repeat protein
MMCVLNFQKGNTSLHIASLAGHEDIVKILVQSGAKVNIQSQVFQQFTSVLDTVVRLIGRFLVSFYFVSFILGFKSTTTIDALVILL